MSNDFPAPNVFLGQTPEDWLSNGGTAANGIIYKTPRSAVAWGKPGCPILPRVFRGGESGQKLPEALTQALGLSLKSEDLDANVLERSGISELTDPQRNVLRQFLYELDYQLDVVAIPAGVPLVWLSNLPISDRTRGALNRIVLTSKSQSFLSTSLLVRELFAVREVGPMTVVELLCVIESAEATEQSVDSTVLADEADSHQDVRVFMSEANFNETVNQASLELVQASYPLTTAMRQFAQWALAETRISTLGEALAEAMAMRSEAQVWTSVDSMKLSELMAVPAHPYEILDTWVMKRDTRECAVFWARVSGFNPKVTLQEIAGEFGVSRERIRQIEVRIRRRFENFLNGNEAKPIQWRAETIRQILGVVGKVDLIQDRLEAPIHARDYSKVMLELAGPYVKEGDWYVLESALQDEPTSRIISQTDEAGCIDSEFAHRCLTEWGLPESDHYDWLTRNNGIRFFNGRLVVWGGSVQDRLVFALSDLGRPATMDEMMGHVGESNTRQSALNSAGADTRLVRVNRTHWGLSSWDLPEYAGTAYSIKSILEEAGGLMAIDDLIDEMFQIFHVAEGTTKTYSQCPMFVTEGGAIRIRTEQDKPYCLNMNSIGRDTGVYHLGSNRVSIILDVNHNMLRGSGTMLSRAAGAILEVEVNANLEFTDLSGNVVSVTYPETAFMGPSLGSVRLIAESLSANEGDLLTLVMDGSDMSVEAVITKLEDLSPSWETIGRFTGIGEPANMSILAAALHCPVGDVREILKQRGDTTVLDTLPTLKKSSKLTESLSMLQFQVEQGRR